SLTRLEIINCTAIQTLPGSIQRLTNLQELKVSGCPDLAQWCESDNSMTLAHIKTKETRKRKLTYSLESYGKAKEQ
ncbi:unnamed protein product, partial [Urochloa humidicola]